MELEVVEFYISKKTKKGAVGTIHVMVKDLGITIRGIHVSKNNNKLSIFMPSKCCKDQHSKLVSYPVFDFIDKVQKVQFLRVLKEEAIKFIDLRLDGGGAPRSTNVIFKKRPPKTAKREQNGEKSYPNKFRFK